MRASCIIFCRFFVATLLAFFLASQTASATIIIGGYTNAFDDAESAVYSDGWDLGDNGGFGYQGWTQIITPHLPILNTVVSGQISGERSLALAPHDTGTNLVGRPLPKALTNYTFSVKAQHQDPFSTGYTGFSGFGLFATQTPDNWFDDALLSFGIAPNNNNAIRIIIGSTTNTVGLGENLVNDILQYVVSWNTEIGTYTLQVTNLSSVGYARFSGTFAPGGPVNMIGAANFNSHEFQRLKFDEMTLAIPEPSVVLLFAVGAGTIWAARRRQKLSRQVR